LHNLKISGEAASAENYAASTYPAQLNQLIEEGGYCARQVFNADETGLFWKKIPAKLSLRRRRRLLKDTNQQRTSLPCF
jgi:hypothetical protein